MGKYRVTWNRSAYQQMVGIAVWYRDIPCFEDNHQNSHNSL